MQVNNFIYRLTEYKSSNKLLTKITNNNEYNLIEINILNETKFISYLESICSDKEYIDFYKNIKHEFKNDYVSCIILYYLGGFVINDKVMFNNFNFDTINTELIAVKSCLYSNLFTGLLYSTKNNKIIINTINEFIKNNQTRSINELLYKNILTEKVINNNLNIIILEENIVNNSALINYKNNNIATHFFTLKSLELLCSENKKVDLNKLKIGITFDVPSTINDFYCNGIRQNALYFFELLKNIGYDAKLIIDNKKELNIVEIQKKINFYNYNYVLLENILSEEFDLIFAFGFSIEEHLRYILKKLNIKIVNYQCGNSYLINTEKILYNQHPNMNCDGYVTSGNIYNIPDQIWSIPQMYKQNKGYWEVLYRTNCIEVPFIWSNNSINFVKTILNLESENELLYKKKNNKVGIFEPNISIMKWCLPCIFICEKSYRDEKKLEHVYVTNTDIDKKIGDFSINNFNNQQFIKLTSHLDIVTNKILSVEKRFITLDFMKNYCDIAVSHQWENPLNYLYLDLAWMGWPILHNAYLCKDVGYYYDEFDYNSASKILNNIIDNHELVKDEYLIKNRKVIDKYLPTNIELQNAYKKLIENLFV